MSKIQDKTVFLERTGLLLLLLGIAAGSMTAAMMSAAITIPAIGFAVLGSLLFAFARKNTSTKVPLIALPLLGYLFYLLMSPPFAEVPFFALTSFPFYAATPMVALLLLFNMQGLKDHAKFFATSFIVLGIPYALWGLYQFFFLVEIYAHHAAHPFANANVLGSFAGTLIVLSLSLFINQFKKHRYISYAYGLAFILFTALLIATGSRGALLATLSALTGFFILAFPSKKVQLLPSLVLGGISYSLFLIMNKFSAGQVSSLYHSALHGRSYNERQVIWQQALEMIKDAPFFGYGIGNYSVMLPQYRTAGDGSSGLNAHSNYMHMGVEIGLVGLTLFAIIILYAGFLILRKLFVSYKDKESTQNVILSGFIAASLVLILQGIVSATMLNCAIGLSLGTLAAFSISQLNDGNISITPSIKHAGLIVITLIGLVPFTLPSLSPLKVQNAISNLKDSNIENFDAALMSASDFSFGTNPFVYIASADIPYNMVLLQGHQISMERKQALIERAHKLYDKALELHPHMGLAFYKKAMLSKIEGDLASYESLLKTALEKDGGYLPAREELGAYYMRLGRKEEYIATMRAGENWFYWRFSPLSYYNELKRIYNASSLDEKERNILLQQLNDNIDNAQTRLKRGLTFTP